MVVLSFLLVLLFGRVLLGAIRAPGLNAFEQIALSWLLGYVFLGTTVELEAAILGGAIPAWAWLTPFAILAGLVALRPLRSGPALPLPGAAVRRPIWGRSILGVAGLLAAQQLLYLLAAPKNLQWDGMFVWALKAKAIVLDLQEPGSLRRYLLSDAWLFSNQNYPLGFPILESWVTLTDFNEQVFKLLGPFFLASIAILMFFDSRRCRSPLAAATPLLLLTCPATLDLALVSYADIPLSALLGACVLFASRYLERDERWALLLSAAMAGGMVITKQEGLILAAAAALLLAIVASGRRRIVATYFGVTFLLTAVPWLAFSRHHSLGQDLYLPFGWRSFTRGVSRLRDIVPFEGSLLLDRARFGLLPITLIAVLILGWKRLSRRNVALPLLVLLAGVGFDLVPFMFTRLDAVAHARTAMERLLVQLVPVAVLAIRGLAFPLETFTSASDEGPETPVPSGRASPTPAHLSSSPTLP